MPYIILPTEGSVSKTLPENVGASGFVHVWGVMCYPDDVAARQVLDDGLAAACMVDDIRRARAASRDVLVSADLALWLAGAPEPMAPVRASANAAVFGGTLTGLILGWIIFRARRSDMRATASLLSAFRAMDEACRKSRLRGAGFDSLKAASGRLIGWSPTCGLLCSTGGMRDSVPMI